MTKDGAIQQPNDRPLSSFFVAYGLQEAVRFPSNHPRDATMLDGSGGGEDRAVLSFQSGEWDVL